MKLAFLCLCLASTAAAAPSPFHYTPHYTATREQAQNPYSAGHLLPQAAITGAYSVELIYPHRFPAGTGGSNNVMPFSSHGFLKYSIPQPAGKQSVEVYYPYDFNQHRILTNIPPMTNVPQGLPFEHPFTNMPQQTMNIPPFDASPLPPQDSMQPLQKDQPTQTNQLLAKL